MANRKKPIIHLCGAVGLLAGFLLTRFVFSFHGMHQFPLALLILGLAALLFSFWAKAKIFPLAVPCAYLIGFAAGTLFRTEGIDPGGGRTDSLWIIWVAVFIGLMLLTAAAEATFWGKRRKTPSPNRQ